MFEANFGMMLREYICVVRSRENGVWDALDLPYIFLDGGTPSCHFSGTILGFYLNSGIR